MTNVIYVEMPDGIEELVPAFLATQREGAAGLAAMLAGGEFDAIRRFAHNLKGTGTAFGFPVLSEMGVRMERTAREGKAADLRGQIQDLRDYLERVRLRPRA